MTREEKITAIYKEMANKEVSFGCKIKVEYLTYYHWETGGEESYSKEDNLIIWVDWIASNGEVELDKSDLSKATPNWYIEELETYIKIIWHPVMIGDVLDRYRTNNNDYKVREIDPYDLKSYSAFQEYDIKRLLNLWTGKRTLIDEQSDECIDFVHSLIKKS